MNSDIRHIGFTGTRKGMTERQKMEVRKYLIDAYPFVGHHGDCVGADADFHDICRNLGINEDPVFPAVIVYPPENPKARAWCREFTEIHQPAPYLERNRAIVDASDMLIATPAEYNRKPRSGTWYTIMYASNQGKRYVIIYPDGNISVVG